MPIPVVLLAGVLLGAPLVSLVDVRDVALFNVVRLDVEIVVFVVLLAGVLLDALLVHHGGVRGAMLLIAAPSDPAMLVPHAVPTNTLHAALLVAVARRRGTGGTAS